jgi:ABC-type amino acid transport substrate-binding protein
VLTVGSDIPYPPFEDFDPEDGTKVIGFDADVITEIATQLDLTVGGSYAISTRSSPSWPPGYSMS